MSVLIKGMKMPSCCEECPLMYEGYLYGKLFPCVCNATDGKMLIKPSEADMRDGLCPLVEIPEHGRLIDADALKETLDYYICEANWGDEVNKGLRWVKDEFINSENTVIEAEGSENHDD